MKRILPLLTFLAISCQAMGVENVPAQDKSEGRLIYCDFDLYSVPVSSLTLDVPIVVNPKKDDVNSSYRCAKITTGNGKYEEVCFTLRRAMDFTLNKPVIKLQVFSPRAGAKVMIKIKRAASGDCPECPHLNCFQTTTKAGEWEELIFDYTPQNPKSNWYQKIIFCPDPGEEREGDVWYFDTLEGPDDDLSGIALFQRVSDQPYIAIDPESNWRSHHIAAGVVLGPDVSPDGNWYYYVRGSNAEHEIIGVLRQKGATFDPLGKWEDCEDNPVINVGPHDAFDGWRILGPAPVAMPDGSLLFFYKARNYADPRNNGCGLAKSTDWVHFTKLTDKTLMKGNICTPIYYEGKFYSFGGRKMYVFTDPLKLAEAEITQVMEAGDGPAYFDRSCIWGNRVFRLEGVDKWFMSYYGSSSHSDFPDRAHIALSDDLIHWKKVRNDQPLFTRGPRGQWDQGGIWLPMIFEFKEKLYLYYEGWGRAGFVADRDVEYFRPGCSQVGVAVCDKEAFLKWCGLK